ncbi:MAG: amidohydrolase family protein [Candidatus Sumerlaeia bacterium]
MRINCHCHIFSVDCVPLEYRNRFLLNHEKPGTRRLHRLLRFVLPKQSWAADFLSFVDLSILEIAEKLVLEMDEAGIELAAPLMMDMAYCKGFSGEVKPYEDQIAETAEAARVINERHGRTRLMPFIAADPRRPNMLELVQRHIESGDFHGVKIYPVMGFSPIDSRLEPLYAWCEEEQIPITTHCKRHGGIPGLEAWFHLADPANWELVLRDFPKLKLNLAHNDWLIRSWRKKIEKLIRKFPNVYTDVSYGDEMWYVPRRYFRGLQRMLNHPEIQNRVLYGTDWYMGRFMWSEASYVKWFEEYARKIFWCRVDFTVRELWLLMENNPKSFLGMQARSEAIRDNE